VLDRLVEVFSSGDGNFGERFAGSGIDGMPGLGRSYEFVVDDIAREGLLTCQSIYLGYRRRAERVR
jgi:hypothetical protein